MPIFSRDIDAQKLTPDEVAAELRNGDALAARHFGTAVARTKISPSPSGTLTVEWSSIAKARVLGKMLDQTVADLKATVPAPPARLAPAAASSPPSNGRLSKLKAAADRIVDIKSKNDSDGDELMALMDDVEKLRPLAKATAFAFIAEQKADLSGIVDTLQKMTNLPLASSGDSVKD